jgi:hypothetical protein
MFDILDYRAGRMYVNFNKKQRGEIKWTRKDMN